MGTSLQSCFRLDTKNHELPQMFVIFIASLSGLTSMAQLAWTSPSIPILLSNSSHMEVITQEEASYFSVLPPVATIIVSPLAAILVDIIGRKNMILLMTIPHIISWTLIIISNSLTFLYMARVTYGISDAIMYCTLPTYIGEISTPKVRGSWGNLTMILMFLGQLLINAIGAYCSIKTTATIFLTVPILQLVFAIFLPESPYFLIMKQRKLEAEKSLQWLRWNRNVSDEFSTLFKDVERQISEPGTLKQLFVNPTNRKALFICVTMRIFQQFSGISAFAVYTQQIFAMAGSDVSPSISAIIYTGILLVIAFAYSFIVDQLGRRRLMLFSTTTATIALFVEAAYFYLQYKTDVDVARVSWIPLATLIFYIITCIGGIGVLPTLLLGELFSSSIKGKAMGVVNIFFSLSIIAVPKLFHYLTTEFSIYVPFLLYGVCTLVSIAFYYIFLPETKRKTLEEIQQILTISKKQITKL